jgi:hypothetical protein
VLGALLCAPAQLLHAARELVAQRLERFQVQQPGPRSRTRGDRRADVREALSDYRRELALQALDLRPQRAAGCALGQPPGGGTAGRNCQALDG